MARAGSPVIQLSRVEQRRHRLAWSRGAGLLTRPAAGRIKSRGGWRSGGGRAVVEDADAHAGHRDGHLAGDGLAGRAADVVLHDSCPSIGGAKALVTEPRRPFAGALSPAGATTPRVISDCHFRTTATEYDRKPGIKQLSCTAN
jgi:hypothetical protein